MSQEQEVYFMNILCPQDFDEAYAFVKVGMDKGFLRQRSREEFNAIVEQGETAVFKDVDGPNKGKIIGMVGLKLYDNGSAEIVMIMASKDCLLEDIMSEFDHCIDDGGYPSHEAGLGQMRDNLISYILVRARHDKVIRSFTQRGYVVIDSMQLSEERWRELEIKDGKFPTILVKPFNL